MFESNLAEMHIQVGNQLAGAGNFPEAIARYQQVLAIQPDHLEAQCKLAEVYYLAGRFAESITVCQLALKLKPDSGWLYKVFGNALQAQGKLPEAQRAYQKAIALQPDFAEVHANLGSLYYRQGHLEEAIASYQAALRLKPTLVSIYKNLANIFTLQGRLDEALSCWQQVIERQPDFVDAEMYLKMGNACLAQKQLNVAIDNYQRAIALKPQFPEAYANLGGTFAKQGQLAQAIQHYQKALTLQPRIPEIHCNLGMTIYRLGKQQGQFSPDEFQQAFNSFLNAIQLKPDFVEAHQCLCELIATAQPNTNNLETLRAATDRYRQLCQGSGAIMAATISISIYLQSGLNAVAQEFFLEIENYLYQNFDEFVQKGIKTLYASLLFALPNLRDDLAKNTKFFQLIGQSYSDFIQKSIFSKQHFLLSRIPISDNRPRSPLRIGFISPHFRRHSVGWCSGDIISALSKFSPEIYLYVTEKSQPDDRTGLFKQVAKKFYQPQIQLDGYADPIELVEEILADDLDILVDLDSVTTPINVEILQIKPARVCLSWLGFEAPFISDSNYFLCDWYTHPKGREKYYTEKLLRMPDSWTAVAGFKRQSVDVKNFRKSLRIDPEQIVYLSIAPATKLNSEMIAAQIKILKQVPNSILVHKGRGDGPMIHFAYQQACQDLGVSFHRIKLLDQTKREEEHRAIYLLADVLLDSYPYNGGTHTLEALWFNLPVVTHTGEQFLSRMGYSFLKSLGIETGIAWSWSEYIDWGIRFGQNRQLRQEVRDRLIKSKQPESLAPLWNPDKFAQDMYSLFTEILAQTIN